MFVKKGTERPFEDNDGLIAGEHAFRITPEDEECEGAQIDRSVVRCDEAIQPLTVKCFITLHVA